MCKCKMCGMPFSIIKERDEHEKECSFGKERKVFMTDEDAKWLTKPLIFPDDYGESEESLL